MDIVIDTSVIIAVITNEPLKPQLVFLTQGTTLIAPPSVHWEISNAFSAMLKQRRITLHHALQALEIYKHIPVRFPDVELDEALRLAAQLNLYAYDAYLLRCAQKYAAPLLTLDRSLRDAALNVNLAIVEVIE